MVNSPHFVNFTGVLRDVKAQDAKRFIPSKDEIDIFDIYYLCFDNSVDICCQRDVTGEVKQIHWRQRIALTGGDVKLFVKGWTTSP